MVERWGCLIKSGTEMLQQAPWTCNQNNAWKQCSTIPCTIEESVPVFFFLFYKSSHWPASSSQKNIPGYLVSHFSVPSLVRPAESVSESSLIEQVWEWSHETRWTYHLMNPYFR
jgi:hypothetical protein